MLVHSSRNGNGNHVNIDVQKYLLAAGISQVVSGHHVCVCVSFVWVGGWVWVYECACVNYAHTL
jgi:hypothetical protein